MLIFIPFLIILSGTECLNGNDPALQRPVRTVNVDPRYSRWDKTRVPYCIDSVMTSEESTTITSAVQSFSASMKGCINFVPVDCATTEYHVKFTTTSALQPYSSSFPGHQMGLASTVYQQEVNLERTLTRCSTTRRCVLRFLANVMGKRNEHQRGDRDINRNIIIANDAALNPASAYRLYSTSEAYWMKYPYDYCSITHNQPTDYAASVSQPAFTLPATAPVTCIPKLETISETDCNLLSLMYSCSITCASLPCTSTLCTGIGITTTFQQSSYTFTTTACTVGSSVGTVQASGAAGYTITNGNTQFTVSPAGLITLATAVPAGTYTLTVGSTTITGSAGSNVPVTVTVTCSGTTAGKPTFSQASYVFSTSGCTAGTSVGSVTATGAASYSITNFNFAISTSGQITLLAAVPAGTYTAMVFATGTQGTASVPLTITVTCSGTISGAPGFPLTSYTFSTTACSAGTNVGTATATNANRYIISNFQFAISAAGQITMPTAVPAGMYTAMITAVGTGGSVSVPATITVTCAGGTSGTVTFPMQSYTYSTSTCTAGTTVGTVTANNANRYTISNAQFAVSSTGQITMPAAVSAGTYATTVTAFGAVGSASVPVTITVACSGTSSGTCAAANSPPYAGPRVCTANPSDLGYSITQSAVSPADISTIVDMHNNERRSLTASNMRKLSWDPCVASSAQAWANKCTGIHDNKFPDRKAPGFPEGCGQSYHSGPVSMGIAWRDAVEAWRREVRYFAYCSPNNIRGDKEESNQVGHYTQFVWAETSLIGCGYARCGGITDVFICNYCKTGNVDSGLFGGGEAWYCPYKQGPKCSACSTGSGCAAGDCLCP